MMYDMKHCIVIQGLRTRLPSGFRTLSVGGSQRMLEVLRGELLSRYMT